MISANVSAKLAIRRILLMVMAAVGALMLKWHIIAGAVIIVIELVFLLFSAAENLLCKEKLSANIQSKANGLKNSAAAVGLVFSGKAGLYKGLLKVENLLTGEKICRKVQFEILAENGDIPQLEVEITSENCGKMAFSFEKLRRYDMLGVTFRRIKCDVKGAFIVMPDPDSDLALEEPELRNALESDEFSQEKGGTDHSEPIGIREYRQGDSYKAVHWKMSFRLEDIYVREYGEPVTNCICIYVETSGDRPSKAYDGVAGKALGLSMALLEQGINHYVAFYSFSEDMPMIELVENDQSFGIALDRLLSSRPKEADEKFGSFEELFEEMGVSRIIRI